MVSHRSIALLRYISNLHARSVAAMADTSSGPCIEGEYGSDKYYLCNRGRNVFPFSIRTLHHHHHYLLALSSYILISILKQSLIIPSIHFDIYIQTYYKSCQRFVVRRRRKGLECLPESTAARTLVPYKGSPAWWLSHHKISLVQEFQRHQHQAVVST